MPEAIKNHKISITIGTVVLCAVFIFTFAFNLGAEQNKIKSDVANTDKKIERHIVECEKKEKKNEDFQKEIRDAVLIIKEDIATIKGEIRKR